MRFMKPMVIGVLVVVLMAAGWLMRGLFSGGAPTAGKSMAAMGGTPQVKTAVVKESALKPPSQYVGHVEAIQEAELYAQVEGIIKQVNFKEGAMVNKGDLLFSIDPIRFQAKVDLAEATLTQARANLESVEAQLSYAESYLKRLKNAGARSVVQTDVDKAQSEARRYKASLQQAKAQVKQSEADLQVARIDLAYTQVRSPITGRVGRAEVTAGDYVSPGTVMMARVVQVDPVRVRFSMSDRDYLDLLKISKSSGLESIKASLLLPNGDSFGGAGALDFVGNRMNLNTGTIVLRLRYDNAGHELVPNSYVKVLMETPGAKRSVVVPQEAVMTGQKGEYVYVVAEGGVVQRRELKLGGTVSGKRIALSGIKAGETVVVQGLQSVRPGQPVKQAPSKTSSAGKASQS